MQRPARDHISTVQIESAILCAAIRSRSLAGISAAQIRFELAVEALTSAF